KRTGIRLISTCQNITCRPRSRFTAELGGAIWSDVAPGKSDVGDSRSRGVVDDGLGVLPIVDVRRADVDLAGARGDLDGRKAEIVAAVAEHAALDQKIGASLLV